eukprot:1157505-Pelagomonas_calceolata.AAC.4
MWKLRCMTAVRLSTVAGRVVPFMLAFGKQEVVQGRKREGRAWRGHASGVGILKQESWSVHSLLREGTKGPLSLQGLVRHSENRKRKYASRKAVPLEALKDERKKSNMPAKKAAPLEVLQQCRSRRAGLRRTALSAGGGVQGHCMIIIEG